MNERLVCPECGDELNCEKEARNMYSITRIPGPFPEIILEVYDSFDKEGTETVLFCNNTRCDYEFPGTPEEFLKQYPENLTERNGG